MSLPSTVKTDVFKYSHQGYYGDYNPHILDEEQRYDQAVVEAWKSLKGMKPEDA